VRWSNGTSASAVRLWLEAVRRRARRVICVSEFTRDEAIRLGGIRSEKTSVAYLGVDAAWTTAAASADVATAPYLLFVGLVKPHKNLMGLLRAFEILMPAIPHRLVVVGRHSGYATSIVLRLPLRTGSDRGSNCSRTCRRHA
jgi:glycosyltransferase involved in cell wall biosynthesis